MAHQKQQSQEEYSNSTILLLDSLYCSDERFYEQEELIMSSMDIHSQQDYSESSTTTLSLRENPVLLEHDLSWDEDELVSLLSRETANELLPLLPNDTSLADARSEAVAWTLGVIAHYSFSAHTASLAVDYLDRFLAAFGLPRDNPWMTQLTAVACLSLAAKVEETQVPLLLDFQVEESKYLFEAKAIKRMELLVLSTLKWKMSSVTPISFLDFIIRRLGLKDHLCFEFLKRCESIIISLIPDSRFMCYRPSIVATATMLHVVGSIEPCLQAQYHNQLLGILRIDKEKAEDCCKLISELTSLNQSKKRKSFVSASVPSSPNGVHDMSFSSDSSNDSWSVSSSPETTLSKKIRRPHTTTTAASPDFLVRY